MPILSVAWNIWQSRISKRAVQPNTGDKLPQW